MWDPWWAAVGWIGSAVAVLSLMQTRIKRLRVLNLIACLVVMIYHVPLGIWPTVALNAVVATINAVHLIRLSRQRPPSPAEEEAAADGPHGSPRGYKPDQR